jgi:hypothetical protein
MKELLQLAWDVLLFRHEVYAQHVARPDVLKRGLALLVLVTLLAGVISLLINVVGDLRPMSAQAQRREAEQGLEEFLGTMREFYDVPPEVEKYVIPNIRAGMEIGFRIEALPTRLPKPLGRVLEDLGVFLSLPFSRLAGWIGYGIWVLLASKLLGGRATASQMLGATALYVVPHVLAILGFVPCLGGVLGLVATIWGIAIYVKALAVVNHFSIGRGIAATVAPALLGGALALLGMLVILVLALVSG